MSEENVEIVRGCLDAFNRGDMPASLKDVDPAFELHMDLGFPEGPTTHLGHDGFKEFWGGGPHERFAGFRLEPDEFIDAGDQVLVPVRAVGRGKGSGAKVEQAHFQAWTLRNCKVVRLDVYADKAEALEAVGLQE